MDLPDGTDVTYTYSSTESLHDAEVSRVTRLSVVLGSSAPVAEYRYLGVSELVGMDYPEPDVFMHHYGSISGTYPNLDRFNCITFEQDV